MNQNIILQELNLIYVINNLSKENSFDNLSNLSSKYPYFSILPIIENFKSNNDWSEIIRKFNINPTLLFILTNKIQSSFNNEENIQEVITEDIELAESIYNPIDNDIDNHDDTLVNDRISIDIIEDNDVNATLTNESKIDKSELDALINNNVAIPDLYSFEVDKDELNYKEINSLHTNNNIENNIDEKQHVQSLLVQMTFTDWLKTITASTQKQLEEAKEQEDLKRMWKQKKLLEALQEENDDIPEDVFQMAVGSIEREDELVSESLAEVYLLQDKKEQAINIYNKLILQNPEKKVYFADKIDSIKKSL